MKLRQLQCLCTVVDAGFNISRAAAILHATQPAVGKQLRLLEEELGVDVVVRQNGRVLGLTEAGERALDWARRALQCTENLRTAVQESGPETSGNIVIATSHAHAKYLLLPAVTGFAKEYPRVRLNVVQGSPQQVADMVREGKADVGVAHVRGEAPDGVIAVPFMESHRVVVVPVGHPLLKLPKLRLQDLAAYPLITLIGHRPGGPRILNSFRQAGLDVHLGLQALDADIVKTYVAAGLGVGIIHAFTFSPREDRNLRMRSAAHLFETSTTAVLLRQFSRLQSHVHAFLEKLDPALERRRVAALLLGEGEGEGEGEGASGLAAAPLTRINSP